MDASKCWWLQPRLLQRRIVKTPLKFNGPVAQRIERLSSKQDVVCSSHTRATIPRWSKGKTRDFGSWDLGSIPSLGTVGGNLMKWLETCCFNDIGDQCPGDGCECGHHVDIGKWTKNSKRQLILEAKQIYGNIDPLYTPEAKNQMLYEAVGKLIEALAGNEAFRKFPP